MMQASAYGRLGREPTSGTTQGGKTWANASLAVNIDQDQEAAPFWVNVVAFGKMADELLRHGKGDLVSVSGRMQVSRWSDKKTGQPREQLQIVADAIISARSVRPSNGRRDRAEEKPSACPTAADADLNDELPF